MRRDDAESLLRDVPFRTIYAFRESFGIPDERIFAFFPSIEKIDKIELPGFRALFGAKLSNDFRR